LGVVKAIEEVHGASSSMPIEVRKQLANVAVTALFGLLKKECKCFYSSF